MATVYLIECLTAIQSDDQPGLFVYLNTGNGFDNGKQWQSSLGGTTIGKTAQRTKTANTLC
ncbi:hypothetical protein BSPWISOXPB_8842 [uncultured Gammaproteobacteria bacterium]|nr:hypothetical protein BSPWISOXPB_8842 [uncultured Gammaproteobacteria bacterium]